MSNARDTGTSPLTPEQNQRAKAVACAVAALNLVQHDECVAAFEVVELADYIHTGQLFTHHTPPPVEAEIVDDAPERDDGDSSATVKVTECQWPGCDNPTEIGKALGVHLGPYQSRRPACAAHAGQTLALVV